MYVKSYSLESGKCDFCVSQYRSMTVPHVKVLNLTMKVGEAHKENIRNDCHLKSTGYLKIICLVPILEAYVHTCTKYEVSMIKPVARKAVNRPSQ